MKIPAWNIAAPNSNIKIKEKNTQNIGKKKILIFITFK